jgi:hypothetical protein
MRKANLEELGKDPEAKTKDEKLGRNKAFLIFVRYQSNFGLSSSLWNPELVRRITI